MANIKFTYAAVTLLSLTTVANSISASNTFTNLTYAAAPARSISFTTEIVPTRSLADDSVSITDSSFVLEITKVPGDSITVSDTPVMAVDIVRTDSINVSESGLGSKVSSFNLNSFFQKSLLLIILETGFPLSLCRIKVLKYSTSFFEIFTFS